MTHLAGKTALVTCGSSGVGRATALLLAKDGAEVFVHHEGVEKEADVVVAEIQAAGGKAIRVSANLQAPDGPHELAGNVREIVGKHLDILVTTGGIPQLVDTDETTVKDFDNLFATNVRVPYFLVQQLLPVLGQGSSVVLLSCLAARTAVSLPPAYAATVGAVHMLVKVLASRLGDRGIRVNAIALGVVAADLRKLKRANASHDTKPGMQANGHISRPDDIASAVVFLASDTAHCANGDILHFDSCTKLLPARYSVFSV